MKTLRSNGLQKPLEIMGWVKMAGGMHLPIQQMKFMPVNVKNFCTVDKGHFFPTGTTFKLRKTTYIMQIFPDFRKVSLGRSYFTVSFQTSREFFKRLFRNPVSPIET